MLKNLHRPLWRHRTISRRTKLSIYNASVIPVLLYGAEAWPLNKTLAARIDGFDGRALLKIEGMHWTNHVLDDELQQRTKQPHASIIAAQKRLRWYGHMRRLAPEHLTRVIADFDPKAAGWRRPRGAPRTRWIDVVADDLRQLGFTIADAEPIAQDRLQWRNLVRLLGSTRPARTRIK